MNRSFDYPHFDQWGDGEYLSGNDCFDYKKFQRSEAGMHLMRARSLMTRFTDVDDPNLLKMWEDMGVRCEVRETKGERWLAFVPKDAYGRCEELYPVVLIFRPVDLLAEAFYEHMIHMAAQGEFIALIFSQEDMDVNDVFYDMLQEILREFPADPTRVYTTGHSHYGEFAMEFTRRHHESIAAIAQQGDTAGIIVGFYGMTQEKLELMHTFDMPLINVAGTTEMVGIFPVNQDAPGIPEDSYFRRSAFPMTRERRIRDWQDRLYAMRCPVLSAGEIAAPGRNKVERVLGFPCDRTDVLYAEGSECYIGDIRNVDGNYHFRVVGMENIPHTTCRMMHVFAWSFLRRFRRELETGRIIENFDF